MSLSKLGNFVKSPLRRWNVRSEMVRVKYHANRNNHFLSRNYFLSSQKLFEEKSGSNFTWFSFSFLIAVKGEKGFYEIASILWRGQERRRKMQHYEDDDATLYYTHVKPKQGENASSNQKIYYEMRNEEKSSKSYFSIPFPSQSSNYILID